MGGSSDRLQSQSRASRTRCGNRGMSRDGCCPGGWEESGEVWAQWQWEPSWGRRWEWTWRWLWPGAPAAVGFTLEAWRSEEWPQTQRDAPVERACWRRAVNCRGVESGGLDCAETLLSGNRPSSSRGVSIRRAHDRVGGDRAGPDARDQQGPRPRERLVQPSLIPETAGHASGLRALRFWGTDKMAGPRDKVVRLAACARKTAVQSRTWQ